MKRLWFALVAILVMGGMTEGRVSSDRVGDSPTGAFGKSPNPSLRQQAAKPPRPRSTFYGPEAEVRAVLDAQVAAWNRGDVAGFMEGYWKSPKTTFVSSSGILRGWQAVLNRYRREYPDGKSMGHLTFSELEITILSPEGVLVLGRWQLEREKDRPGGVFTLMFRRFPEGWRIINDHTSVVRGQ